ncbi:MAG: DUF4296 domain-containing protein, partial [Chitinophagia bacterium]|nr:DUF4296 domain-containing protein [Chitinophagia bacterium]
MKYLIFIIGFFFIVGCNDKTGTPSGVLGKEKMQSVMWDIIRAEVFTEQFIKKDSSKNIAMENLKLQNAIFSIHKVTRSQYFRSYDYYISHTDLIRLVLDSMSAKAERDRFELYKPIEIRLPVEKFSMLKKAEVVGQFKYFFSPF